MPDRTTPQPGDELDPDLLGRYLANECSEAEAAAVRRFLMAHPEAAGALGRFVARLDGADAAPAPPDATASWAALRARMREHSTPSAPAGSMAEARAPHAGEPLPPRTTPPHGHHAPRGQHAGSTLGVVHPRHWWRYAFTVLTAAAAALVAVTYAPVHRAARSPAETERRVFVTGARERAEIRLSDGTRIRIAPGSRLRIAGDFGIERRDVYLEGEAFFEVRHDPRRPFTVFAGSASAHDIGTAFSVRNYADDHAVQVTVRDGAVALSGVGPLGAGDVGRLTNEGRASVVHGTDLAALLGWLDGNLVFHDAPLGDVLRDVRRWYGVDIRLADSTLLALPFTGTLAEDRTDDAVGILAATLGLRASRRGGAVMLDAIPGTTPRPAPRRALRVSRAPRDSSRTSVAAP